MARKSRWHRLTESEINHQLTKIEDLPLLIKKAKEDRTVEVLTGVQMQREAILAQLLTAAAVFELVEIEEDN